MSQNELKPCRKCGELDYEFWDGYGTQAYLLCINCGSSEDIQVSDLYTIEERVAGVCDFEPAPSYMNKKEVIEKVNAELIKEWNTRASSSAPEAKELLPTFCTIRDGLDEIHLECRFPNGEKYAAVIVDIDKPELAEYLANCINKDCKAFIEATLPKQLGGAI